MNDLVLVEVLVVGAIKSVNGIVSIVAFGVGNFGGDQTQCKCILVLMLTFVAIHTVDADPLGILSKQ